MIDATGQNRKNQSREGRPTILPLAFAVGLLVFFVTDASPDGLTGLQGFLAGVGATFVLFLSASALSFFSDKRTASWSQTHDDEIEVTRSSDGEHVTIHIHSKPKSRQAAKSRG